MKRFAPILLLALAAAACGSSSTKVSSAPTTTASTAGPTFAMASATGVGQVLTDDKGKTVYVLTADGKTSLPCEDSTGCTKAWPDVTVPSGQSPKAGAGVDASLLGTKTVGSETYVTYKGWLLYEFVKDTAPGTANGEGIKSFGGTWYALDAAGNPVEPNTHTGSSGGGISTGY